MIDTHTVYAVLALIAIYAAVFFLSPNQIAQLWERDDLPVHEIMQHFRYWERRRVCIVGLSLATCVILASSFAASAMSPIAVFVGVMSLAAADAFQTRRLSRQLPSWTPSTGPDENGSRVGPALDLLFGKKPKGDRGGE